MVATLCIPLFCLIGILNAEPGESSEPKPTWDFSFAIRGWYSNAGQSFLGNDSVSSDGQALAPSLELDGLRNRFLIRLSHQFSTVFSGQRQVGSSDFEHAVERVDSEAALGWELRQHRFTNGRDIYFRTLGGYKSLVLLEDDLTTPNTLHDFKQAREGPFLGLVGILRGTWGSSFDWDLKTMVAYAYLDTKVTQKMVPGVPFRDPFHYFSDGTFLDLSFNFYLPFRKRDVQAMIGYKGQWFQPRKATVMVRRVNPTLDGTEEGIVELLTQKFQASGFIAGISFKF